MRSFRSGLLLSAVSAVFMIGNRCNASPTGAGECTAGDLLANDPSTSPHRTRNIVTGSLADVGLEVLLDGQMIDPDQRMDVAGFVPHEIELRSSGSNFFRGFLVRIEDPRGNVDTFNYLQAMQGDPKVQVSEICTDNEETGGITHTSNDKKSSIQGMLTTEYVDFAEVILLMDVTIVVQNRQDTSEWYHSRFTLRSVESVVNPTVPIDPSPSPQLRQTIKPGPTRNTKKKVAAPPVTNRNRNGISNIFHAYWYSYMSKYRQPQPKKSGRYSSPSSSKRVPSRSGKGGKKGSQGKKGKSGKGGKKGGKKGYSWGHAIGSYNGSSPGRPKRYGKGGGKKNGSSSGHSIGSYNAPSPNHPKHHGKGGKKNSGGHSIGSYYTPSYGKPKGHGKGGKKSGSSGGGSKPGKHHYQSSGKGKRSSGGKKHGKRTRKLRGQSQMEDKGNPV